MALNQELGIPLPAELEELHQSLCRDQGPKNGAPAAGTGQTVAPDSGQAVAPGADNTVAPFTDQTVALGADQTMDPCTGQNVAPAASPQSSTMTGDDST